MRFKKKSKIFKASWAFGLALLLSAAAAAAAGLAPAIPAAAVLPQPTAVTMQPDQAPFALDPKPLVTAPAALVGPAQALASRLGLSLTETAPKSGRLIRFELDPSVGPVVGAYRLQVREAQITISAAEPAGAFYAVQTLLQMLPKASAAGKLSQFSIPALDITDAPRFVWRGLMLDVARHFHGVERVKRMLDQMAVYKLNRLHLHLSDDSGWRVAIKAYPLLTTIGARGDYSNPKRGAQFYSAADIRAIVAYAAERYIEVVPEIDMPGHSGAAARAYPEFFDGRVSFNPAHPGTYRFIDTVLGELASLFPGRYIHFGGDEVWIDKTRWGEMPDVLAMARDLSPAGGNSVGEAPQIKRVEAEFARRMVQMIKKHGRIAIGWDEVIAAGLTDDMVVQWWRMDHPEAVHTALKQGQAVVLSPVDRLYLDYPAGLGEPGAPWEGNTGGPISVEKIVAWEPMPVGLQAEQQARVLGLEAPLWTENVRSESYLEYMLYPRLAAVAEVAWREQANSAPETFVKRLEPHIARWKAQGLNVRGSRDDANQYRVH
ncbi:beta-N-acetylhexosaminidase [Paucibacter sp. B2R-40]|uniref:beta-N-acetylhexosaminidase n=1 Tax=Paucibacter sp. B2R-40 TaxID=2893554 RepID=UPI0021E44853|nr:beta-N-acetylhexosaminidase [Paucibacter sp. B2R-40]MCV2356028.1 beta-N-acetylhexosaminidase [Paucibacter sp. B2R-40]